jgi:hypothetical protein
MHFNQDLLHNIFAFAVDAGTPSALLNVCLVCKEWNNVASKFYWRHVGLGTHDGELAHIEWLIAHLAADHHASCFYPTNAYNVKELSLYMDEMDWDDDERSLYASRLQELCGLLPGVRTLNLNLEDEDFRAQEKHLSMFTEELLARLPGLRSLHFTAEGLDILDPDDEYDVACDVSIKATLSRMLERVKLDTFGASMICPQSDWFPLETLFSAQSTLRELDLGFAFTKNATFILGALAKSGFTRLERLGLQVDAAYPANDAWAMVVPETFKAQILQATADFVRVCTNLQHFTLDVFSYPDGWEVDFWTFLQHFGKLPRLKSFSVDGGFFEDHVSPPEGYKVAFPFVEHFRFRSSTKVTVLNDTLASWHWPSLQTMEIPKGAWTPVSLKNLLEHAQQLQALEFSTDKELSLLQASTGVYPRVKKMRVRFMSSEIKLETVQEDIVFPILRIQFPNASIHIAVPDECNLYYGKWATMDGRYFEKGHEDSEGSDDDNSDDGGWATTSDEEEDDYVDSSTDSE